MLVGQAVLVGAPVEHVHPQAGSPGARLEAAVADGEIAQADDRDAQQAGQALVLVPGAVLGPVAEHDRDRVGRVLRRGGAQRAAEHGDGVVERTAAVGQPGGELGVHALARGQRIGQARRRAHVVLEHTEAPARPAHQVEAGNGDPNRGGGQAHELGLEVIAALERAAGHHSRGDDLLLGVDVGHEAVERTNALRQAALQQRPLAGFDQAGHRVEREGLGYPVEHEAHTAVGRLGGHRPGEGPEVEGGERADDLGVDRAHRAVTREGFVEDLRGRPVAHWLRMDVDTVGVLVPPSKDP